MSRSAFPDHGAGRAVAARGEPRDQPQGATLRHANVYMLDSRVAVRTIWDGAMRSACGEDRSGLGAPVADPLAPASALAGTVAHDLGNLLTVILGNAELLIESLPDRPEVAEFATLILAASQRGTELTERLDRLARRVPVATEPTDLHAVVAAFARRLAPELPGGITFETSLPAAAAPVMLTPATATLVLEELVGNALAALRGQGRLHIALSEDVPRRRIRVVVEDDGPGIAPETLRRIGEWRFTSGVAGHKTGVGLALVQRVAGSCGGSLSIHPAPGGGTRVTFELAASA